jgi:hypothetical protein
VNLLFIINGSMKRLLLFLLLNNITNNLAANIKTEIQTKQTFRSMRIVPQSN